MHSLDSLWTRGKEFFNVEYVILGGAMSWVSESNLVAAISNSGAFGVLASGAMSRELLEAEIIKTKSKTKKPFGVNLIVINPKFNDLVDVCIENKISHVFIAGGMPPSTAILKLKENGVKVLAFAPNLAIAKRLVKSGISGLVIEGNEAGGHIGPVSTAVLAQEILPNITEVPVFIAGGIGRGEAMISYLQMGASGVQMGTIFVCSTECVAHNNFKQAFIHASARDAKSSIQIDKDFYVIPVRAIENQGSLDFVDYQKKIVAEYRDGKMSKEDAQMKIEFYWGGALRRAVVEGDVVTGSLMAGQSVGMISEVKTVDDIIKGFVKQANDYLKSIGGES